MFVAAAVLIMLSCIGHGALWIGVNNRWHGLGLPRKVIKSGSLVLYIVFCGIPLWLGAQLAGKLLSPAVPPEGWPQLPAGAWGYLSVCAVLGAIHLPVWAFRRWQQQQLPESVRQTWERVVDIRKVLGAPPTTSPRTRLFCRLPFNHLWEVHVSELEVALENLPAELEGLSICHLSDLHISHRIERPYYEELVRIANELRPDLVALTGDICDKADRICWITPTLGNLQARIAKFFVLGNHDLRTGDVPGVRAALVEAGFHDVGGRVEQHAGLPLVVAGNELPWFPGSLPRIESLPAVPLKLLLSHSPDQFRWAQRRQFDLMLAGHTHGGQVRFPILGPVVCPSVYGTRYASGFFAAGATMMHVSRGSGSLFPYRLNCRPQVVKLVLRRTPSYAVNR